MGLSNFTPEDDDDNTGGGNDVINAGSGNDTVTFRGTETSIDGGAGTSDTLVLAAGAEGFLRGGVHLAEGALVPRAAVGDGQDQRLRLGGRAVDGFDVADRDHGRFN